MFLYNILLITKCYVTASVFSSTVIMVSESGSMALYKWLTFGSMYVGYTLTVVNRKSFSFALPAIISSLHLTKDDIGENSYDTQSHEIQARYEQV